MAPTRRPGPVGTNPETSRLESPKAHRPGPSGLEVRFPTLEVYAAQHGNAFSGQGWPLSLRQIELARPIFGRSLRYEQIRIVVASFINAPTTLGPYIRVALPARVNDALILDRTLIHELTHVWQYQTRGMRYMSNSLCQQAVATLRTGSRSGAYLLTHSEVVKAGAIDRLGAEKQATLIEYWFANEDFDSDPSAPNAPRKAVRDEPVCKSILNEVRAARPLSKTYILEKAAWGSGMGVRHLLDDGHSESPGIPWLRIEF